MYETPGSRLEQLTEEQAAIALQNLFTDIDVGTPLITEEAIRQRGDEDRAYIRDIMQASGMTPDASGTRSHTALLQVIYDAVPDMRPAIDAAVDDVLTDESSTLVVESAFLIGTLAVAVAAAIMRPRLEVVKKTSDRSTETKVVFEAKGIKDLGGILKALSSFL